MVVKEIPRIVMFGANRQLVRLTDSLVDSGYQVLGIVPPIEQKEAKHLSKRGFGKDKTSIPIIHTDSVNEEILISRIKSMDCDFIVNWGHSERFEQALLQSTRLGVLNIHPGHIPNERGLEPITGAIRNGAQAIWQTIYFMGNEFDKGAVVNRRGVDIPSDAYRDTVETMLRDGAEGFYFDSIEMVRGGSVGEAVADGFGTYFPKLAESDGVIEWNKSSADILNLVRSRSPFMPCTALLSGSLEQVLIWRATAADVENYSSTPGQVLAKNEKKGCLVKTGDSAIWIERISTEDGEETIPSFSVGTCFAANWMFEAMKLNERLKALESADKNGKGGSKK